MAFINGDELSSVISWTTEVSSSSSPTLPSLAMKYGAMPNLTDLLTKIGDHSSAATVKRIFGEFKSILLGIAEKEDKSISLEPCTDHGRHVKPTDIGYRKEEETQPTKLSNSGGGGGSCGTEEGSAFEVQPIYTVSTKERVFNCEQKLLILCITLLFSQSSLGKNISMSSLVRSRIDAGGIVKLRRVLKEMLGFDVSDRSVQRIRHDF